MAVGLYSTGAYWFTASTSFANPAVTVARALTNTFAGIRPPARPASSRHSSPVQSRRPCSLDGSSRHFQRRRSASSSHATTDRRRRTPMRIAIFGDSTATATRSSLTNSPCAKH